MGMNGQHPQKLVPKDTAVPFVGAKKLPKRNRVVRLSVEIPLPRRTRCWHKNGITPKTLRIETLKTYLPGQIKNIIGFAQTVMLLICLPSPIAPRGKDALFVQSKIEEFLAEVRKLV